MAEVRIQALTQRFGDVTAVDDVTLSIADGEFVTLLGPSGCGKSTTLGAIAGLERATGGRIEVGGRVFFDGANGTFLPAEKRNCGLVFQSYALWPHMTVFDNCAFALKLRRVAAAEQKRRVLHALELVEMAALADRLPHQLSGGQQQRVALARTLVYEPDVLLLDEPLSNLDAKLRERARGWLRRLQRQVGLTTIFVTHDQTEALAMSDRIAVMNRGRLVQYDTPRHIYEHPADAFVADFIGDNNFLPVDVLECVQMPTHRVRLADGQTLLLELDGDTRRGGRLTVAVRPEKITIAAVNDATGDTARSIRARIIERSYLGGRHLYLVDAGSSTLRVESPAQFDTPDVSLHFAADPVAVLAGA